MTFRLLLSSMLQELYEYHGELPSIDDVQILLFTKVERGADNLIEDVIGMRELATGRGVTRHYLFRWTCQPLSDCMWITESELRCLREGLYQCFIDANSTGPSSSNRMEFM